MLLISLVLSLPWQAERLLLVRTNDGLRLCRADGYRPLLYQQAVGCLAGLTRRQMHDARAFVTRASLTRCSLSDVDDAALLALLRGALRKGELVVLRELAGATRAVDTTGAKQRRLVREIERTTRGRLAHEGRLYKLVADVDLGKVPGRGSYEVVRHDDAVRLLTAMAAQVAPAGPDLSKQLAEAASHLTHDWRPPLQPDGLVLLRRIVVRAAVSRVETPITPSEMRKIVEEHENEAKKVDFVLELRTEDGYPVPEAAYEATLANGETRTGVLGKDGTVILEDVPPGPVLVRYPDDDDVSAKAWAVYARRALDRQDFYPVFSLLQRSPTSLEQAIQAYDKYFNDYTGGGLLQDLDTVFTDTDAHTTVATLLAAAGIGFTEDIELIGWDEQAGG